MKTTTDKIVYFVVAVDLSTGTKYIDDETLLAVFPNGSVLDTETNEWCKESDEEYTQAVAILNNSEWETE